MDSTALGMSNARNAWRPILRKACHTLAAAAYALLSASAANAQVSQTPLYLGGGDVPGNLTLVPSVEWPTINSVANLGAYVEATAYLGYFDPRKCYRYINNATESLRYFNPTAFTANHRCTGTQEWSGNYMNWAATQTIDPFRWALTGGYRVRDTATETWLEKARHDGQGTTSVYPNRRLPATGASTTTATTVDRATPMPWQFVFTQIQGAGNKMRFTNSATASITAWPATAVTQYDGGNTFVNNTVYELSVRVKVCVSGLLEANCKQYGANFKPEGLIQQYSDRLRIGVFGYLNDTNMLRDGGVLRARQKFVGPTRITPGVGVETNPNVEWNVTTGQLITNPDSADATATAAAYSTAIANSGAMNYLNKFGQLTTNTHKSFDPVSELYYSALRYLKHQGNVPEYTAVPGNTGVGAAQAADGFPIITNWDDPIQYTCQKNVILGIGDVNTHRDKNLPGSTFNTEEPSDPPSVSSDSTVDVVAATNKVGALEGLGTIGSTNNWSGRNNSAYMAGLAYIANTSDIRPEVAMPGKQTVSTHWVDVLEAQVLEPPARNQYYLATKYGGLRIPDDVTFNPMTAAAADIQLDWWHSPAPDNGQTLTSTATPTVDFNRPDNYYLAGNASQMVTSLGKAFQRIAKEVGRTSASSVAANSTRVDTGSAVFQATFNPKRWSGDLAAYAIDTQGNINGTAAWNAAVEVDALSAAQVVSRNVLTIAPPVAAGDGSFVSTTGENFAWASLTPAQQANLQNGDADLTLGQKRLDYLRGSRTFEQDDDDTDTPEPFRQRDSRLGDIVNSDPQFVQHDDFGYALLDQSVAFMATGAGAAYRTFRSDITDRTPMIVVGANDGMLHGINAESLQADGGGDELFAFVPATVYANLADLTDPEYEHRYFVDATPRVADAWFDDDWHTLVIGALGAGGKSYFALDVTDPESVTSSKVLWEFTHPELGFTRGQAAVVPLPNGEFGVVVTSGYETGATDGHIWILNPADGSIIKTIVVPGSGDLGAPLVADLNNDRVADRIYVGDTNGNLWRFDLVGDDPADWNAPAGLLNSGMPLPLFVAEDAAGNRQAITAALTSAFNEHGQHMVFFGTGRFYRVDDNVVPADPPVDSFYGIIDRGMPIGRDDLVEQEVLAEVDAGAIQARGVTAHELNSGDAGWFLDLEWKVANGGTAGAIGERVVTRALVRGDRVVFSTLIPNADPCESGGTSWLMELSTWTGGRLAYSVFDINLDEDFDADDYITVTDENGDVVQIPVSGRKEDDAGIIGQAAVIAVDEGGLAGDEVKVLSSSSGNLIRVAERGGVGLGRQSWRELR